MEENKEKLLEMYKKYINELAEKKSEELFTNGGIKYASELMAVLFKHTEKEARIFCQGFKPDLIKEEPYWGALQEYLCDKKKSLKVLVETGNYKDEEPIKLLFEEKSKRSENDGTISIKLIKEEDKENIFNNLSGKPCNFAVFDDNKFRFEYAPEDYQAFGSFNKTKASEKLIDLFDSAFKGATELVN